MHPSVISLQKMEQLLDPDGPGYVIGSLDDIAFFEEYLPDDAALRLCSDWNPQSVGVKDFYVIWLKTVSWLD